MCCILASEGSCIAQDQRAGLAQTAACLVYQPPETGGMTATTSPCLSIVSSTSVSSTISSFTAQADPSKTFLSSFAHCAWRDSKYAERDESGYPASDEERVRDSDCTPIVVRAAAK